MNTVPLVKVKIMFEEAAPSFSGATMYARLENITSADIASRVTAEYVKPGVAFNPEISSDLAFVIAGNPPDPRASYGVRVHIDVDGDGKVSQGDFISMQSYPVITFGHPSEVSILVRQVK